MNSSSTLQQFRFSLIGQRVTFVEQDLEGLGIKFGDRWNLAIWAKYSLLSTDRASAVSAEDLNGATLLSFAGDDREERFCFSNGVELVVDISGEANEAMALYGPMNMTIVWTK